MARKTIDISIAAEGRDHGKTFRITEMPAAQGEEWALRALNGMARAGLDIPEEIRGLGMISVAIMGFKAFVGMAWADLKPLNDELFDCITCVMPAAVRPLVVDDTEEIWTRLHLRKEVFELHTGFFARAARMKAEAAAKLAAAKAAEGASTPST